MSNNLFPSFSHRHYKSILPYLQDDSNTSAIEVNYYLRYPDRFKMLKGNLISPSEWKNDPEDQEEVLEDNEYFESTLQIKSVHYIHQLVFEWFDLIIDQNKSVDVFLFENTPYVPNDDNLIIFDTGKVQIYLSPSIIEFLLKKDHTRIYFPFSRTLHVAFDIQLSLDNKMISMQNSMIARANHPLDFFMEWILKFRFWGIGRLSAVLSGLKIESDYRQIRKSFNFFFEHTMEVLERPNISEPRIKSCFRKFSFFPSTFGPMMMIFAIGNYIEKNNLEEYREHLEKILSSHKSPSVADLIPLYKIGISLEVEEWFDLLTTSWKDYAAILDMDHIRALKVLLFRDPFNYEDENISTLLDNLKLSSFNGKNEDFNLIDIVGIEYVNQNDTRTRLRLLANSW